MQAIVRARLGGSGGLVGGRSLLGIRTVTSINAYGPSTGAPLETAVVSDLLV
jgi:hypothetical protein